MLSAEEIEGLLPIYRAAFDPLDELSPAKQSMDDDQFRDEMKAPTVTKYLARDRDGHVAALACVTNDTDRVPWLSPAYYRKKFPEQFARGAVFFVGTILSNPALSGWSHLALLMREFTGDAFDALAVVVMDCCRHNVEELRIPDAMSAVARRFGDFERIELDQQRYYAFVGKSRNQGLR